MSLQAGALGVWGPHCEGTGLKETAERDCQPWPWRRPQMAEDGPLSPPSWTAQELSLICSEQNSRDVQCHWATVCVGGTPCPMGGGGCCPLRLLRASHPPWQPPPLLPRAERGDGGAVCTVGVACGPCARLCVQPEHLTVAGGAQASIGRTGHTSCRAPALRPPVRLLSHLGRAVH